MSLLIVGLAPAAHGGNRTGRVFTGDASGDFLWRAMHAVGLADFDVGEALFLDLFGEVLVAVVVGACGSDDNGSTNAAGDDDATPAAAATTTTGASTRELYRSVERLRRLHPDTVVLPGHDYGESPTSTIGRPVPPGSSESLSTPSVSTASPCTVSAAGGSSGDPSGSSIPESWGASWSRMSSITTA